MPNALQLIKQDHKKVEALFQKYKKARGQESKRKIAEDAMEQLEVHAAIEEEIFYPAAKRELEDGEIVEEAIKEHSEVKDLIEELRSMESDDEDFDSKFAELVENVQHHVKEEENEMLPQVKDTELDLAECGEQMAERKEELMEDSGSRSAARSGAARAGKSRGGKSGRSARR